MNSEQFHVVIYQADGEPYIKSSHPTHKLAKAVAAAFCEPHKAAQVEQHMERYRRPRGLWKQGVLPGME